MAEIFYSSSDPVESRKLSKRIEKGELKKIAPKIYTSNFSDSPEAIIKRNIYQIIEHFYPGSVLSHRSAFEVKPTKGVLFLSGKKRATIKLPGVTIQFLNKQGRDLNDIPFLGLFIAHEARAYLENLTRTRNEKGVIPKNISREDFEKKLLNKLNTQGENSLNKLRDEAKKYSKKTKLHLEFNKLNKIISALLGTKNSNALKSDRSIAYLKGEDYDEERLKFFTDFFIHLKEVHFKEFYDAKLKNPNHFKHKAFFESYFSNYIEGTEFELEEAEEIIFDKKISSRPKDAHDILGTFEIVSDAGEMKKVPKNENEFIEILKYRHEKLMHYRPEVLPGMWKEKNNRAGNTHFVDFNKVEGTLKKSFSLIKALPPGLHRALFVMLLVTEVHPFTDGNGRIGRIMMNAELESSEMGSIIIPNVYREDYLLSLKSASRQQRFNPYTRMLERALKFSSAIDFSNYKKSLITIKKRNWFLLPDDGKIID